ncbi:cytochrome c biogenesis protein CcdA [uncultured Brachyspira sp.]|uniref:protein-disulfide reductase DsbD family protein n=1 Tax=uncultured Brachyspira sp. TaxID=221953 RepID=UPI00259B2EFC|nr:cytochrome c biogenesis protein CcdA [uncultured Brachyspira sp.]
MLKLKIILFIIFNSILYSQYNNLLNFNTNINDNEVKIIFSLKTNENKLIVNADIPKNYYGYLESSIANKIKFFADNKEINAIYPKGEKFHNDIIIKGKQEFILNIDIKNINFIKANYQLCSEKDNICLPPKSEIIFGEEINNISEKPKNASLLTENNLIENQNILITLIIIFASGVASIFLPCSYPLLSITISIFSNSNNQNKKSNILSSFLFSLGIITTYTILGGVVSAAGFFFNKTILFGSIGYNPIVLTILILFFLYFTFSMAGFYEIRIPNFLKSAKSNAFSKNKTSLINKYIMGLLTGIVATPCAAPIIAFILEIGFLNPIFATVYMFVYSFGFSLVLFILGAFASILSKMPKSGSWTIYIKYIFTFIMFLICFYYLNILFGILGFNKISFLFADLSIIIFAIFIYLIKKKNIYLSKFEIKIFVSVLILSLIIGSSYSFIKSKSEINNSITYEEALEISKQNKKNILIDFSAVWCANCFELKEKVFESEELKKFIYDNLIFVEVDVDKRKDIAKEFNIKWLPYIIIIDENKNILYSKNSFSSFDEKIANEIKKDIENIIK